MENLYKIMLLTALLALFASVALPALAQQSPCPVASPYVSPGGGSGTAIGTGGSGAQGSGTTGTTGPAGGATGPTNATMFPAPSLSPSPGGSR